MLIQLIIIKLISILSSRHACGLLGPLVQGFQGYGFHLSATRFEIIQGMQVLIICSFCCFGLGPLVRNGG